jgi:hypothetical protein
MWRITRKLDEKPLHTGIPTFLLNMVLQQQHVEARRLGEPPYAQAPK